MLHDLFINGTHITYWEAHPTKRKTVLLIHGLGGDHRGLISCALHLKDYRTVIPDLPGYGLSDPFTSEHTLARYSQFIDRLRIELDLGQSVYVVGHSFGCAVALRYTRDYGAHVEKLGLLNPIMGPADTLVTKMGNAYAWIAFHSPSPIGHFMLANRMVVYVTDRAVMTPEGRPSRRKILQEDYENYKRANIRTMKESVRALQGASPGTIFPAPDTRVLILAGNKDTLVRLPAIEKLSAHFISPRVVWGEGGHLLPLEHPTTTGEIIRRFLDTNA